MFGYFLPNFHVNGSLKICQYKQCEDILKSLTRMKETKEFEIQEKEGLLMEGRYVRADLDPGNS